MPANPDRVCPHENFDAQVDVNRLSHVDDGPIVAYSADLRIECRDCGERFRFIGVEAGVSPRKPMCSVDEFVLAIPIRPAAADPDFGTGIPGYAIRYHADPGVDTEHLSQHWRGL